MHPTKDVPDKIFSWLRSVCSTYLSCFIAFWVLVPAAFAQYGDSLCGFVTDLRPNLVSSATVTFSSTEMNEQWVNICSGDGIYQFNTRPPPHFLMAAETAGFRTISDQQVIPAVNGVLASALDIETVSLGETIGSIQIQRLTLYNHDIFPKRLYEAAKYLPNSTTIMKFGINKLPIIGQPIVVMDLSSDSTTIANHYDLLDMKYQLPYNVVASIGYQRSQPGNLLVQSNYNAIAGVRGVALSPYSNFIDYNAHTDAGNLDALVVTLKHSFAHHFILEVQYALATAMDENYAPFKLTGRWHLLHWLSIEPGLRRPNSIEPVLHRKALLH